MHFNQESTASNYTIRGYQENLISIQGPSSSGNNQQPDTVLDLKTSFILTPQQLIQDWGPSSISSLTANHFAQILELQVEIILMGTGNRLVFPDPALTIAALENGIGVESMDSPAACRTYNILMHEGRNIAAAIVIEK